LKKLLFVLVPLVVIVGAVVGLGFIGVLNIPFVTPNLFGKPVSASTNATGGLLYALGKPVQQLAQEADEQVQAAERAAARQTPPPAAPKSDPETGNAKLASLWNGLEPDELAKVTANWKLPALAQVMLKMDEDQVTKYLATIDPKRADAVSRAIQIAASAVQKASKDGAALSG
jgi:hypothetical protein